MKINSVKTKISVCIGVSTIKADLYKDCTKLEQLEKIGHLRNKIIYDSKKSNIE